jgi:hypothetical protein
MLYHNSRTAGLFLIKFYTVVLTAAVYFTLLEPQELAFTNLKSRDSINRDNAPDLIRCAYISSYFFLLLIEAISCYFNHYFTPVSTFYQF